MVSGDLSVSIGSQPNSSTSKDLEMTESSETVNNNPDIKVDIIPTDIVAVIGTGNFGKAITAKLEKSGVQVVVGTRNPVGSYVSIEKALQEKIVILAVPTFSWQDIPLAEVQPGTILIDCSNRTSKCPPSGVSQAELLQQMLPPGVQVVKGFNTISAYELENMSFSAGQQVPIAGNSLAVKQTVGLLLERLGYHCTDMGGLDQARLIENIPLSLFTDWMKPFFISAIIWLFLYFLTFARYHFCVKNELAWSSANMHNIFVKYINKTCDAHALVLLAACYLPGVFAAYIQLWRGTKYSIFPNWLDNWLKMRKQLGIFMLFSASIHACFYVLLYTQKRNDWQTNIYLGAGVIAYFFAAVLGVTSLPSVSKSLSWKEFRMIQSWLGWLCLLLVTTHCAANGWSKLFKLKDCFFLGSEQVPLILPAITIVLKIPIVVADTRLTRIRQGKVFRR